MYIQRGHTYQAVQFTGKNRDEVMKFLGIVRKEDCLLWCCEEKGAYYLDCTASISPSWRINQGDWLVCHTGLNDFNLYSEQRFKETFEQIGRPLCLGPGYDDDCDHYHKTDEE